jgi:hypothetical protein
VIDRDFESRFREERLWLVYCLDEDDAEVDAVLGWAEKSQSCEPGPSLPLPWGDDDAELDIGASMLAWMRGE